MKHVEIEISPPYNGDPVVPDIEDLLDGDTVWVPRTHKFWVIRSISLERTSLWARLTGLLVGLHDRLWCKLFNHTPGDVRRCDDGAFTSTCINCSAALAFRDVVGLDDVGELIETVTGGSSTWRSPTDWELEIK